VVQDWKLMSGRGVCRTRRDLIRAAVATVVGLVAMGCDPVQAQAPYPNKPIRIVVGYAAGGPTDIVARVIAAKLGNILGQRVYVENQAGGSGNIATDAVARAPADGYTLLLATLPNAVNESLYKTLRSKFEKDFVPIGALAETSFVLVVHPSLGVKNVSELIALAKSKPGDLMYASAGKGTGGHLAAQLFSMAAGVKMIPVHYKGGGDSIKDLLSGEMKMMFSSIPPVLGFVQDGKLLGLATSGPKRDAALPALPTIAESGVAGFDVRLWFGLIAPAGTPREAVDRLSAALQQALTSDEVKTAFAAQSYQATIGTPEQFGTFFRSEVEKWKKVVDEIGGID
jgi:tripartite-type tricarboxylate transporter receptor subunit TctC